MVRSVLYLSARKGSVDDIVELYRSERILERAMAQDGCLGTELQVSREPDAPILVTALWRDAAAYDGWVANSWRQSAAPALAQFIDGDFDSAVRGAVYEVVLAAGPAAA